MPVPSSYLPSCPPLHTPHSASYPALPCLSTIQPPPAMCWDCGLYDNEHAPDTQGWLQALPHPSSSFNTPAPSPVLLCLPNVLSQIKTCIEHLLSVRLCSRSWGHRCEQGSPSLPGGADSLPGETDNNQIITQNQCKVTTVIQCGKGKVQEATGGQVRECSSEQTGKGLPEGVIHQLRLQK